MKFRSCFLKLIGSRRRRFLRILFKRPFRDQVQFQVIDKVVMANDKYLKDARGQLASQRQTK